MPLETIPLFPEPKREVRVLSEMYAVPLYRWKLGVPAPKYTKANLKTVSCDECFALQHETRGKYGSRHPSKMRRTVAATKQRAETVLHLCHGHAVAWQERDEEARNGA